MLFGSRGLPCADAEVRIAADGEVLVRGYRVMRGYLDDPSGTAAAIGDGGVPRGAAGEADLLAWCRSRMAGYKAPRSVAFASGLPLNAAGKVDKPRLAARHQIALQLPLVTGSQTKLVYVH